jgi:glucose 1-dehydrogenase
MSTRHGGSGGVFVNVSSIAARLGSGGQYVDYAASKAGLDALTKGLADEVAAEGVRVVSVRPGLVDTAIHGKGGEPDRAIRLADRIPMRRAGTAREIARTILWLLSGDASYITGTTIDVSGGR